MYVLPKLASASAASIDVLPKQEYQQIKIFKRQSLRSLSYWHLKFNQKLAIANENLLVTVIKELTIATVQGVLPNRPNCTNKNCALYRKNVFLRFLYLSNA
jgi:hypothetical protein